MTPSPSAPGSDTPPAGASQAPLLATLRSFPRGFWILVLGMFVNRCGTFVIPFLTLYVRSLGFPAATAGLALTAYGLGLLGASVVGGDLSDRIGRRRCIVLSMGTTALCMLALGQASTLPQILAATFLTGFTAELSRPASSALIADLIPGPQRVTAYALYRLAINAGWAFGPALGGLMATRSYSWLFLGDALTSALFACLAWRGLPQGRVGSADETHWTALFHALRHDRRLRQLLFATLAAGLAFMQLSSTFGLQVTARGYSHAAYGMLASLNGLLVVLLELPLTRLTQRLPRKPTLAAGFILIGLGFSLNLAATTLPAFVAVVLTFTLGEMLSMPLAHAYIADIAPESLRGRYQGAYGLSWALALILAPAFGLTLFEWSPPVLWIACGLSGLAAALIILRR